MEVALPGGNLSGAVLVDGTVRRQGGPWTPSVQALLNHLEEVGFVGAPRFLGFDAAGREEVSFLPGETVGDRKPWPTWVHSNKALEDVGAWLRDYHRAVADFVPSSDAHWRIAARPWRPGDVVGHNDAAPYNAVWDADGLVGFIDWDFAAPCLPIVDLAFVACAWVPLHARDVAVSEGFTDFASRPARLRALLDAYGFVGTIPELLSAVHERIASQIEGVRALADAGDPLFIRLVDAGVIESNERAQMELREDAESFASA